MGQESIVDFLEKISLVLHRLGTYFCLSFHQISWFLIIDVTDVVVFQRSTFYF